MIDTVILMLPREKITVITGDDFPSWDLQSSTRAYKKYVKNPTKRDKATGLYFPRLTGFRRRTSVGYEAIVKIEFSAPKLLYKNNLDELSDSQFEAVINALRDRLYRMGIVTSVNDLASAEVRAVHYSRNIELKNGYTVRYVIGEIAKIGLDQRLDLTKARYMNEGQSLCVYAVSHSIILYDKIADMHRSVKRAIDKEFRYSQLGLFERLKNSDDILRFEVRLSQPRKMKTLLRSLGFPESPTFRDVFSSNRSIAVLTHYWEKLVANNSPLLFAQSLTAGALFHQILQVERSAKRKQILYLTGLILLSQDLGGMRELREALSTRIHDRSWYRLSADLKKLSDELCDMQPREWFGQVTETIRTYAAYRVPKNSGGVS